MKTGSTNITPRLGQIVLYTLTENDAEVIIRRRRDAGLTVRSGNEPREGDTYPAVIVRDWSAADERDHTAAPYAGSVNLQVLLDGNDSAWVTSRSQFDPMNHGAARTLIDGEAATEHEARQVAGPNDVGAGQASTVEIEWVPDPRGHWQPTV